MFQLISVVLSVLILARLNQAGVVLRSANNFQKEARIGSTVELTCSLTDSYGTDLEWKKVSGRLSDESEEHDGRLTIHDVKVEDHGEYECVSKLDTSRSKAYLIVIKETSNNKNQKLYEKNVDDTVELKCEFTNQPDLKWKRVDGPMPSFRTEYGAPNNRLMIYYLTEADSGDYECFLPDGRSSQVHLSVSVPNNEFISNEIEDPEDQVDFTRRVIETTTQPKQQPIDSRSKKSLVQSIEKELNTRVDIICSLETDEKEKIEWRKVDGYISDDAYPYHERLIISDLKEEDFGAYECFLPDGRVESIELKKKENRPNEFEVDQSVTDDVPMTEIEATSGHSVELVCQTAENNYANLDWKRLDFELPNDRISVDEHKLRIDGLNPTDSGVYECIVNNGEKFRFKLNVKHDEYPSTTEHVYDDTTTHEYHESSSTEYYYPESTSTENYYPESTSTENYYPESTSFEFYNEPQLSIREEYIYAKDGQSVENTCSFVSNINDPVIEWYDQNGQLIESNDRITIDVEHTDRLVSTLKISSTHPQDTGRYECRISNSVHSIMFDLRIDPNIEIDEPYVPTDSIYPEQTEHYDHYTPEPQPEPEPERPQQHYCDVHEATCSNGQCIPKSALCDGQQDCSDGSDENCGSNPYDNRKCQPNEVSCRNGDCIQKIWLCDGEKDCKDGSDEETCSREQYGMCRSYEHQCKNGIQCISKGFLCDKQTDCTDNSDEIGCVKPTITLNPVRHITVTLGETFTIECHATGFPIPFINWRLNWGHVCEEPRCNITNNNGVGILIVSDARYYDAGAYSCESINSNGREFAVPDTIVEVIPGITRVTTRSTTTTTTTTQRPAPISDTGCNCHNHSDKCTCSGICYECQHNTYGDKCQYCLPGYFGDATIGTPFDCLRYQTTTTTTQRPTTTKVVYVQPIERNDCHCNGHSEECTCSGICIDCQHNTQGKYCQECKPGFEGNPLSPEGCRQKIGFLNERVVQSSFLTCNPHGTAKKTNNSCICKSNVVGKHCDQCAEQHFNLITNRDYKRGCLSCFCNGLEVECKSSDMVYSEMKADFEYEHPEWSISDKYTKKSEGLELVNGGLEFSNFDNFQDKETFMIVPEKFKGNKLSAYGGNITLSLKFNSHNSESNKFELRLSGSHVNIVYLSKDKMIPNVENQIVVPLFEDEFKRYGDNGKVNREHMLMALSDIKLVMIRASYSSSQYSIRLSQFKMDVAQYNGLSEERLAKSVEVCSCPHGYTGNSCENCDAGYKRASSGFYLGLCEPAN